MADETRVLRNAQINLIAIQAQRIALLEVRLDAVLQENADLKVENQKLKEQVEATLPKVQVQA